MTVEDINKTLCAATINQNDQLDFFVGNFKAIEQRYPDEIHLSANDLIILNEALQNTQNLQEIATNLIPLLESYQKTPAKKTA